MGAPPDAPRALRPQGSPAARGAGARPPAEAGDLDDIIVETVVPAELREASRRAGFGDLRRRAARAERDVRELSDALAALAAADLDLDGGAAGIRSARSPLREAELAAASRAAGLSDTAARHAIRAAELLRAAGLDREARESLAEATDGLAGLGADVREDLMLAWERLGDTRRASELGVEVAEQRRTDGHTEDALRLARRCAGLDRSVPGLHRCWGLALLACGEPDSALGHLARWRRESGDALDAAIWHAQAVVAQEDPESARKAVLRLAARLGLASDQLPVAGLAEAVEAALAEPSAGRPHGELEGFWQREELAAPGPARQPRARAAAEAAAREAAAAVSRPRVFIAQDTPFHRVNLSDILAAEDIEVLRPSAVEGALERLRREVLPLDLMLLPLTGEPADLRVLDEIRALPRHREVPILGIAHVDRSGVEPALLRARGVVGLVDKNAIPEWVVHRVNSVVRREFAQARRFERAPVFLAVDVESGGRVTPEYATSLSRGGMSLLTSRALPLGGSVALRFRLPGSGGVVEARGKVLWLRRPRRRDAGHRIGILFEPLDDAVGKLVSGEVARVLAGDDF
jgi:DNA-binding NarL/FixJ family response regulator